MKTRCNKEIDPVIEIIKGMHCDPERDTFYDKCEDERESLVWGLIKEDACERLGISRRHFQDILNALNKNSETDPIYICGQPLQLEITEERIDHKKLRKQQKNLYSKHEGDSSQLPEIVIDKRTRYCTPCSMHPIFLQLNVSQLACLMSALAHYSENSDSNMAIEIGEYIYSQLSEYGISRLEKTYAFSDSSLKRFLEDMADYVDEDLDLSYHSDQEFFREFDYKKSDLLGYYCKSGRACDIELMINGVRKKYRDVNIHFAENGYEVNHDDVKDFFSLENVYDIKPDM